MIMTKKRKYTFRKGQPVPYESGSLLHMIKKLEKGTTKNKKKKK
jgi:hypothetical protein